MRYGKNGGLYAYSPRSPDLEVDEDERGRFLEALSLALAPYLPEQTACIRWDTRWDSPFTSAEYYSHTGQWKGAPRTFVRELRMNTGTHTRSLRKSPVDHLSPDTVVISLTGSEEDILMRMRQTTRNSIRRSLRNGLVIRERGFDGLSEWYTLYRNTAEEKGLYFENESYFHNLFAASRDFRNAPSLHLLTAEKDGELVAGSIIALCGKGSWYMYAGSSKNGRLFMANYGLQWKAIQLARANGCSEYDLMGVPPNNDPYHSMYGLYTFKTGLGGHLVHYSGCWDYVYDADRYQSLRNAEMLG